MNKTKFIGFRVTETEYNKIKKKAERVNLSISRYVSLSALDKEIIVCEACCRADGLKENLSPS
jgi:hypothetical protein